MLTTIEQRVCGRHLAQAATRIWFHPECREKQARWLATTQAQLQSVRTWRIGELFDQMYGNDKSEEYRQIVTPKIGNSLYARLKGLVDQDVLEVRNSQRGVEIIWPERAAAGIRQDWGGNTSNGNSQQPAQARSQRAATNQTSQPSTATYANLFLATTHASKNPFGGAAGTQTPKQPSRSPRAGDSYKKSGSSNERAARRRPPTTEGLSAGKKFHNVSKLFAAEGRGVEECLTPKSKTPVDNISQVADEPTGSQGAPPRDPNTVVGSGLDIARELFKGINNGSTPDKVSNHPDAILAPPSAASNLAAALGNMSLNAGSPIGSPQSLASSDMHVDIPNSNTPTRLPSNMSLDSPASLGRRPSVFATTSTGQSTGPMGAGEDDPATSPNASTRQTVSETPQSVRSESRSHEEKMEGVRRNESARRLRELEDHFKRTSDKKALRQAHAKEFRQHLDRAYYSLRRCSTFQVCLDQGFYRWQEKSQFVAINPFQIVLCQAQAFELDVDREIGKALDLLYSYV
ncbi:hypothetical protein GQX73_g10297 [Xylaria multiplex]|uniref:Uncharacterized protein n=1 Tax=Xylaria multiplex TaxID=323545 RepID=A0A7C8IH21_9PEZI|nr:hypothetical protein GQX73_g10297 [Xylaria multiplex]